MALPQASAALSIQELVDGLRRTLIEIADGKLRPEDVSADAHMFDFGYVDSLSAVTFLAHIEERYGVRIEDIDLVERLSTLEALAAHILESR
jgi:acyl carrier protein